MPQRGSPKNNQLQNPLGGKTKKGQSNSEQKVKLAIRENSSNFTFKNEEEPNLNRQLPSCKPTLPSMSESNMGESLRVDRDNFISRENYDELAKMYRILQMELNKAFDALLEFKNFEEKHANLQKEFQNLKQIHENCAENEENEDNLSLQRELEMTKEQNEQLRRRNKKVMSDLGELNRTFEKGIQQLKSEMRLTNNELENENQKLRIENTELKLKNNSHFGLENQLIKKEQELENERKQWTQKLANSESRFLEMKSSLKSLFERNRD